MKKMASFFGVVFFAWVSVVNADYLDVLMPGAVTTGPDVYLCTAVPVNRARTFVTGFVPVASMNTAHHIILSSCSVPGVEANDLDSRPLWHCGHGVPEGQEDDALYPRGKVCQAAHRIVYAWARDADELTLPDNTGFEVGEDTEAKFIVLQVHYKNEMKSPDYSGVKFRVTDQVQ